MYTNPETEALICEVKAKLYIQVFWGCDAVSLGRQFTTFRIIALPSSSGLNNSPLTGKFRRWRQNDLSKYREVLAQRHSFTSQKT
jgi:hypothetical protein